MAQSAQTKNDKVDAVFFGAISSLVQTSEMQREAYLQALSEKNYPIWSKHDYVASLVLTGGALRLRPYAKSHGLDLSDKEIDDVHARKCEIFQARMRSKTLEARPGVLALLAECKEKGIKTAFTSNTVKGNVDALLESTRGLSAASFDLVLSKDDQETYGAGRPAPDVYRYAMKKLGVTHPVAIEDSQISLESPVAAGIPTVATMNENCLQQDFSKASVAVADLPETNVLAWLVDSD